MLHAILFSAGIWLAAVTFLVGVPAALAAIGDYRSAKALGVTNPSAVIRNRFFIPRRVESVGDVAGRSVWINCWRLGCTLTTAGRVVEVTDGALVVDAAGRTIRFRPSRGSRSFGMGRGAATGAIAHDDASGHGLVVFT